MERVEQMGGRESEKRRAGLRAVVEGVYDTDTLFPALPGVARLDELNSRLIRRNQ